MTQSCRACGSDSTGSYVCHYCGAAVSDMSDPASERRALDELHGRLLTAGSGSEKILQNAFVPTNVDILIDAGLRMLPILEQGVAMDGAAGRLRAIIIKLDLMGNDSAAQKAVLELKKALEDYRRSDRVVGYWVIAIVVVLLGGLGYWIWS